MKKVVFLIGYFPYSQGGAELQSYQIAKKMKNEYDVHFISICKTTKKVFKEKKDGFTIWLLPYRNFIKRIIGHNQFLNYYTIKRIFLEINPDYVYQRCATYNTWICGHLKNKFNYRFAFHIANDYDVNPIHPSGYKGILSKLEHHFIKKGARKADCIFAQNSTQLEGCKMYYGRMDARLIYNFSNVVYQSLDLIPPKGNIVKVVWVANLKPVKNPDAYARIAREFAHNNQIHFLMIGSPSSDNSMTFIRETEKEQNNFTFLGKLENDKINEILSNSHLVINTSTFEGFSNVFLQAWFRGCPVVSLNVDPDNLIERNQIGFCAKGSEQAIVHFLNQYIKDESMQVTLRNNSVTFANKHLSEEIILPKIINGITGYEE